jgi:Transposase DDE domain group 1
MLGNGHVRFGGRGRANDLAQARHRGSPPTPTSNAKAKRQARRVAERAREGRFRQAPRLVIRADEATLTPFGGGAVLGELVRRIELIPALDAAIETAPRVGGLKPVKQRARGCSPGEALVAVAESMLCGGDSMVDLERLRADGAGAELRAVAQTPAASTACQLARRFRRSHLRAAEAALAKCANAVDVQLGRRVDEAVTLDFDSSQVEVYGRRKPGAAVNYQGQLAYQPLLCSWAQRGRMLATELLAGSDSTRGEEPRQLLGRALSCLPEGHGDVSARFDTGFFRIELLADCRARGVRFSISVPRSSAMWSALERIADDAWEPAEALNDAEVAETTYAPDDWEHEPLRLIVRRVAHQADALSDDPRARRRRTIPREQLALGLAGEADTVYGYSFILCDLPGDTAMVERHHRERAQIEERIKDQKLGVSLRRLPLSDLDANRFWLHCTALALNLLALLNDLMFGPEPPGHLPRRRQAKFVRRMLLCVPARVIHHARQITLRLPAALLSAEAFARAYHVARGLAPPALA